MNRAEDRINNREQIISELHTVALDFAGMESQEGIYSRAIEAAEYLLEFDRSVLAIEQDGYLHPKAASSGLHPDEFTAIPVDDSIAGKTYRTGESLLIDDVSEWNEANPQGPWMSAISVPVAEFGNFQAVSTDPAAFDDQDLQLTELLMTHASHHLERIHDHEQLAQQNDRLEEFASVVSHDLRNPLNVAKSRAELAHDDCESEHLHSIEDALDQMDELIDNLLQLAKGGHTIDELAPVTLETLVTDCWQTVTTDDATLVVSTEQTIRADQMRAVELFENLFRNAIEHGGSDVTVTVGELDSGFYVEDDGPGIPRDERADVLEAGYSTADSGTGFGLSIVDQIATGHGWTTTVTDSAVGGVRIEFTGVNSVTS